MSCRKQLMIKATTVLALKQRISVGKHLFLLHQNCMKKFKEFVSINLMSSLDATYMYIMKIEFSSCTYTFVIIYSELGIVNHF